MSNKYNLILDLDQDVYFKLSKQAKALNKSINDLINDILKANQQQD